MRLFVLTLLILNILTFYYLFDKIDNNNMQLIELKEITIEKDDKKNEDTFDDIFSRVDITNLNRYIYLNEHSEYYDNILDKLIYKLVDNPSDIVYDNLKGILLFYLSGNDFNIYNGIKLKDKILYTLALQNAIMEIESGGCFNYDLFVMSPTKAFGRFQINGSTLGYIIWREILKSSIDLNMFKDFETKKYLWSDIKDYCSKINRDYLINDLITYSRRFNKSLSQHISCGSDLKRKIFMTILYQYRKPFIQSYLSLIVLKTKESIAKKYVDNYRDMLQKTVELYNGSKKRVKRGMYYKEVYANKVYNKYIDNLNSM